MISPLKITDWSPDYFIANRSGCNVILEDSDALSQIPLLNSAPVHSFKDRQLVRFRGMVQDKRNPEYYFQQYEVKDTRTEACEVRCGMYTDSARCLPHEMILVDSEENRTSERGICVVISTPGLNEWAKEKFELPCSSTVGTTSCKRNLDEGESMDCSEPLRKKEKVSNGGCEEMDTECNTNERTVFSKDHILNFPVPTDDGKACIVKMYEDPTLKLNEIIEVIGFVSLDPLLSTIHDSDETMTEDEMNVHHPPASLVPRLHAVKIISLSKQEIKNAPEIISKAQLIRSDLRVVLSQVLFGDELAADYLICHLLSSIYARKEYFCIGAFPLNITHFPVAKCKTFAKDLYKFLTLFVKKSHLLEVTLENLNDFALMPKKDYECNRLTSGVLQLSENTHLVIDETGLTTGQLTAAGRDNYNAICELVNFQTVSYDFKFYRLGYDTDIPILILSETKSFVPCPTQIVLKTDSESGNLYSQIMEMAEHFLKDGDRLANIRQYIEVIRNTKFEFSDDIVPEIQSDFIKMRQRNHTNADELHSLMVLARLLSLSHGLNTLTSEYWKKAVDMERERSARLSKK